jgi:hypothetical protein
MTKKSKINYTDLGSCACGQRIFATDNPLGVMHAMPYCQKFLELEPDEFLTYVRRSRGIPDAALERVQ